jgi:hypothetical protein
LPQSEALSGIKLYIDNVFCFKKKQYVCIILSNNDKLKSGMYMKIKQILFAAFCAVSVFSAHSQSGKSNPDYQKFYLSIDAGQDYALGTSNTVLSPEFTLPFAPKGFGAGVDGAYFFTKNYGVGVKYHFYTADEKNTSRSEYITDAYDVPVYKYVTYSFDEKTHFFGPAVYAKWSLGKSKWRISANVGVVYLYNKLSKIKRDVDYVPAYPPGTVWFDDGTTLPSAERKTFAFELLPTVGFTLSAGIQYQITPIIGIGVYANGISASQSSKYYNYSFEESNATYLSRKINRTGLSAGINFSF